MSARRSRRARTGGVALKEVPLQIDGLKAWFDSRSLRHITLATGVSAWNSRAGSLGSVALSQATAGNQPLYASSVSVLNGRPALQFDGTDDVLQAATASSWTFLHDNTGATIFTVERVDSTGPADQLITSTYTSLNTDRGVLQQMRLASFSTNIGNGSGTLQNNWVNSTAQHFARDVSRWRAWAYGAGQQTSAVSGNTLTNADAGGQTPGTGAPLVALRLSRSVVPLKGYIAQVIIYGRVLTSDEIAQLGAWAAKTYGVAQ